MSEDEKYYQEVEDYIDALEEEDVIIAMSDFIDICMGKLGYSKFSFDNSEYNVSIERLPETPKEIH